MDEGVGLTDNLKSSGFKIVDKITKKIRNPGANSVGDYQIFTKKKKLKKFVTEEGLTSFKPFANERDSLGNLIGSIVSSNYNNLSSFKSRQRSKKQLH